MMNELTLPADVAVFSRGSLEFLRPPTREEWDQVGRYVVASRTCSLRWLADWRRTGRRAFGDEAVLEAERQLELEFKDLRAAEALERLESGAAARAASDEHAFVVARLCKSTEDADRWLETAEREDLSAVELQRSIKAGSVVKDDAEKPSVNASDKSVGIVTIEGIRAQFDLWLRKVRGDGFPNGWDDRRRRMVLELLRPMVEVSDEIEYLGHVARTKEQSAEEFGIDEVMPVANKTGVPVQMLTDALCLHKTAPQDFSVAKVQRFFRIGYQAAEKLVKGVEEYLKPA